MSELGDIFGAWRKEKQEKRASNLDSSIACLEANGYEFEQLSEHHFRLGKYDFWPSTGKYLNRENKRGGRGVLNLMARIDKDKRAARTTPVTQDD